MNSILKKSLHLLSLGTFVFSSCNNSGNNVAAMYGAPTEMDLLKVKIIKTVTENNLPIKGLSVKIIQKGDTLVEHTNNEGVALVVINPDIVSSITIEDIDKEKNLGSFKTQKINLTNDETTNVTMKPSDKL